jgi:hypothetical protein
MTLIIDPEAVELVFLPDLVVPPDLAALANWLPGQACSTSSADKRAAMAGSGLAGRLMAAPPDRGDGKIWTDVAGLSDT